MFDHYPTPPLPLGIFVHIGGKKRTLLSMFGKHDNIISCAERFKHGMDIFLMQISLAMYVIMGF